MPAASDRRSGQPSAVRKGEPEAGWSKPISRARDRLQSRVLVAVMLPLLVLFALRTGFRYLAAGVSPRSLLDLAIFAGVSLTFAVAVWGLRAATPLAACAGGLINFVLLAGSVRQPGPGLPTIGTRLLCSGLTPLLLLFVLTFAATRAGKRRKQHAGLAEAKRGRNAAQIIANLGAAALAVAVITSSHALQFTMVLAALCEATADTVSSEVGQAFGGTPWLLTSGRRVPAGTDGAVSVVGTMAGVGGSALVALAGEQALGLPRLPALLAWLAGAAGLLFDSLLGATIEHRGWLGNDLVNFASTLFAAALAYALLVVSAGWGLPLS